MRKFSKILALVLAFAMVLCPVLTAAAETESVVDPSTAVLEADITDNVPVTATLTVMTQEEINAIDFKIKFAKGVTFNPETDTVIITEDSGDVATEWDVLTSYADDVLTVVALDDSENMEFVATELYFNITLTVDNASDYEFYLTKIFAVGAGAQGEDEIVCTFPCADNTQSGVIDVEAARNDCPGYIKGISCTHENVDVVETPPTCTQLGSIVKTCRDCGKEIERNDEIPLIDHSYTVEGTLVEDTEEAVGYYGYDVSCESCGKLNTNYYDEDGNLLADIDWDYYVNEAGSVEIVDAIVGDTHTCEFTKREYDETGHWKVCECGLTTDVEPHVWGEGVETTPAQPGVAGVMTYTCECGATKTEEIPALPVGPKLDTRIEQGNSYAAVNDTISLVFLLKHKTVTNAGYDDYKVEFSRQTFTNKYMYNEELDVQEVNKLTSTSSTTYYSYSGIGMYELNVPITVTVKCYKNSEYVAYNTFTLNVKDMIIAVHNGANTADSMKQVIVDLLYLGTEAQKLFGTEGTDLATVGLPTENFNVEQTTTFDPETLATTENYEVADAYKSISGLGVSFNASIAKNPGVYYFINKMATSTFPRADVTIYTSYTNGLNGDLVEETVTGDKVTYASSRYYYVFNKIAFYDLSQVVTTTVKYNDNTVITINYTVESYIKKNYTNATQGDLLVALAKFSKSARYHFIEKTQA